MNATHLHLLLTHFPIVRTIIGVVILFYAQIFNNNTIKKVAFTTFIAMAILTIPVFLTGEEAEESIEHLVGISEQMIKNHEEIAELAIWFMGVLGILSLINLFVIIKKMAVEKILSKVTLVVAVATCLLFAKVGYDGGAIRHTEIATTANINNNTPIFGVHNDDD